jgi:hypothetical protein
VDAYAYWERPASAVFSGCFIHDRYPATECLAGGVEDKVEAVALSLHLATSGQRELSPHELAKRRDDLARSGVPVALNESGVVADVREKEGKSP